MKNKTSKIVDIRALASDDWKKWRAARRKIFANGSEALPELLACASSSSHLARCRVAMTIAEIGGPGVFEQLVTMLADESPEVVYDALIGLGILGDVRAIDVLLPYVVNLEDEATSDAAASSLSKFGHQVVNQLKPLLESGKPGLRILTANILSQIGGQQPKDILLTLLNDQDTQVQIAALEGFVLGSIREVCTTLRGCLNDEDEEVRDSASYWIKHLKCSEY